MPLDPGPFYIQNDNVGTTSFLIGVDDSFLYLKAGVALGCSNDQDGVLVTAENTISNIFGNVISVAGNAFHLTEGPGFITVGLGGSVVGGLIGILGDGGDYVIINGGTIAGTTNAIHFTEAENSLANSGAIVASLGAAVFMNGGDNDISNTGYIAGHGDGIRLNSNAGIGPNTIDNSGTIIGGRGHHGIACGNAAMDVTNSGRIVGGAVFGSGADSYDGSHGTIVGTLDAGGGDDALVGGDARDDFMGGLGADDIEGGGGRDRYIYADADESSGDAYDTIADFDAKADHLDLDVTVDGISTDVAIGQLRSAHFSKDLKNAIGSGQLDAGNAVLFTPDSGNLKGHTFLVVDANGNAGFQNGADYVIDITDATRLDHFGLSTFI